ncbi:MAG: methylenetetrahydrofolate reductase [Kiritimatiellae bacterium]|nr:methylenetetrahydrofolate reductase [Kiritimatiellia bacterium]
MKFFKSSDLIEILTPKQDAPDFETDLRTFGERYKKIMDHNGVASITDNPLGNLHFAAPEVLSYLSLEIDPELCLIHLNTFHAKKDLDALLTQAKEMGVRYLLCVSGDGSQRLARLAPSDLGVNVETVTSVELLAYIEKAYGGHFICGAAFNHYEPVEHEMLKMKRKIAAGAKFIITQPVIGRNELVLSLSQFGVPVFAEAWMTKRIDLLQQCLGSEVTGLPVVYDPLANLQVLRESYPDYGIYYSLLGFKRDWNGIIIKREAQ